jgi:diguanylate cyclase (GGDEF)-like protein
VYWDLLANLHHEKIRKLDALKKEQNSARLLGMGVWMTGLVLGWVVGLSFAWRTADRILKPLLQLDQLMLNPDKNVVETLQSPSFSNAPQEIISLSGSFYKLVTVSESLTAQLRDLANTDGLTSLGNRRRFDEVFSQEWKRGLRSRQPLSLLLLDVDHFKLYNDSYGHVEGDLCLGKVADAIKSKVLRSTDLVCRVGGEEFAILLPETGLTEACRLAEVIINALDSACIDHESSPVASLEERAYSAPTEYCATRVESGLRHPSRSDRTIRHRLGSRRPQPGPRQSTSMARQPNCARSDWRTMLCGRSVGRRYAARPKAVRQNCTWPRCVSMTLTPSNPSSPVRCAAVYHRLTRSVAFPLLTCRAISLVNPSIAVDGSRSA